MRSNLFVAIYDSIGFKNVQAKPNPKSKSNWIAFCFLLLSLKNLWSNGHKDRGVCTARPFVLINDGLLTNFRFVPECLTVTGALTVWCWWLLEMFYHLQIVFAFRATQHCERVNEWAKPVQQTVLRLNRLARRSVLCGYVAKVLTTRVKTGTHTYRADGIFERKYHTHHI